MLSNNKEIMKKLINKLRRKKPQEPHARITNETIAEHRERILAGGRRFKYPVQYARHRLVISAISIAVAALLLLIGLIYYQLYRAQSSNDFMYRVTKVLPLPVASIDGQPVLYGDYLMKYRSSVHYLQEKEQVSLKTDDGKRQSDRIKQEAMADAVADAYAIKLAGEKGITVTDSELQLFLQQQRESADGAVSSATYHAVILDYYGWSADEYEHATYNKLLRQKVSYAVDDTAKKLADTVASQTRAANADLKTIADTVGGAKNASIIYGVSGMVPKVNQDGGLAKKAATLKVGEVSDVIRSTTGDGYYIIKLVETNDTQVSYQYIHVLLTTFDSQLADLKKSDTTFKEYIAVPKVDETTTK